MADFEQCVCQEIPHLRRYARSLVRDAQLADDLVQDCLERALRKRHLWRPYGRLRSWLFRILYHTYLNQKERFRHQQLVPLEEVEGQLSRPASQEGHAACWDVAAAVDRLPDDQRAAVLLMALEGPDYRTAAGILGIAVGTLRSRLSRGREALRRMEQDQGHQLPVEHRLRRVK